MLPIWGYNYSAQQAYFFFKVETETICFGVYGFTCIFPFPKNNYNYSDKVSLGKDEWEEFRFVVMSCASSISEIPSKDTKDATKITF